MVLCKEGCIKTRVRTTTPTLVPMWRSTTKGTGPAAVSKLDVPTLLTRTPHLLLLLCNNKEVVYYEWIKREPKIRGIYECRCDERLQTKTKKFTLLPYTGLVLELEHLQIETRLISERFANVMGECEN